MKKYMGVLAMAFIVAVVLAGVTELRAEDACAKMCVYQKGEKMNMDEMVLRKFHMVLENEKELGLSSQQVDSLKKLKIKTKKDLIKKEAEIDLAVIDVKSELWKDEINLNAINPLIDKKYEFKKEKAKILVAALAGLKSTLSKEQVAKLKTIYSERCEMCGRKRMMCRAMMKKYACPECPMREGSESKGQKEAMEMTE